MEIWFSSVELAAVAGVPTMKSWPTRCWSVIAAKMAAAVRGPGCGACAVDVASVVEGRVGGGGGAAVVVRGGRAVLDGGGAAVVGAADVVRDEAVGEPADAVSEDTGFVEVTEGGAVDAAVVLLPPVLTAAPDDGIDSVLADGSAGTVTLPVADTVAGLVSAVPLTAVAHALRASANASATDASSEPRRTRNTHYLPHRPDRPSTVVRRYLDPGRRRRAAGCARVPARGVGPVMGAGRPAYGNG